MQHLKTIGSLSEIVDTGKDRKRKLSLSEELRLERERLFGGIRRRRKNKLPSSVKNRSIGTKKVTEKEIITASVSILRKIEEELNTPICDINAYRSLEEGGMNEYIKNEVSSLKIDLQRNLIATRIMVCYILYHCFNYEQNRVATYFGIHRDFTGAANQILSIRFEDRKEEEELFRDIFDYFMKVNNREYA